MIKNLLANSLKLFLFKGIQSIVWLVFIVNLTKLISTKEYGIFWILYSSILIGTTITTSWISASILRFFSDKNDYNFGMKLLRTSFKFTIFNNIVFLLIVFVLCCLFLDNNEYYLLIGLSLIWYILFCLFNIFLAYFRVNSEISNYGIINSSQIILACFFSYGLVKYFDNNLFALITGFIFSNLILIVLSMLKIGLVKFGNSGLSSTETKYYLRNFFRYGSPIVLLNIFSQGLSNFDKYIISYLHGSSVAGIYSASYSISEQAIFALISIFSTVSTPIFFKIWKKGDLFEIQNYLGQTFKYMTLTCFPLLLFIILAYKDLGSLLIDSKFEEGFFLMPITSMGAFFVAITVIYTDILTCSDNTKKLMICYFLAFLCNVVLNILLVPKLPLIGSAIATMGSYLVLFLSVVIFSRKVFPWKIEVIYILKLFVIVIITYLVSYYVRSYFSFLNTSFRILYLIFIISFVFLMLLNVLKIIRFKGLYEALHSLKLDKLKR